MNYIVVLVMDDVSYSPEILDAWEKAGVGGITIFETSGLARERRKHGYRDDVPLMPTIRSFLQGREEPHQTIFSIVDNEVMVERLIAVTEAITGKLSQPNTGILFAIPVSHVAGLPRRDKGKS